MKIHPKREIPSKEEREIRKEIIRSQKNREARGSHSPGFAYGNNKTGICGGIASKVLIWNMPYIKTCPGASELCKSVCYNAAYDGNTNSYANLMHFNKEKRELMIYINKVLQTEIKKESIIVRLHSEGDFFSEEYVRFWKEIVFINKNIKFWAYTKSWIISSIKEELEELEKLDNINIYYSWDETMNERPINHKLAILTDDIKKYEEKVKQHTVICPEQYGMVDCCADCGICINNKRCDVIFYIH